MKLQINTVRLQDMISRAVKGAGNNKLIPLTSLMEIRLIDNELVLTTTDATNYLYIKDKSVMGDDFRVTVEAETFSKLISKLTCEYVTLELEDKILKVEGNGNYLIALPLDENGELIEYPNPLEKLELNDSTFKGTVNLSTVQSILTSIKPSLATTMEVPCYTGYYFGDEVIGTNTYMISSLNVKLFPEPTLISAGMLDLLAVFTEDKVNVDRVDNVLVFSSTEATVYGYVMDGIEDYQISAIEGLLTMDLNSMCRIPRNLILQVLDRLSLFVNVYDKNGIYLEFKEEGLEITSKSSSGVELIPYTAMISFEPFKCVIDIQMLYAQLKAQTSDSVELWFGTPNAIKLVDGDITQIVALLEDGESGE